MNNKAVLVGLSVLAFLIALLLVIAIVRLLLGGRLRMPGGRSRQARLGIVDAFDLDRQRQLIIVRRDNTEHLIMIGGPNDVLIESEIIRMEARDVRPRDKLPDQVTAPFGDRIPAPFAPLDHPEPPAPAQTLPPADEPLLPMSLPNAPAPEAAEPPAPPARAPTFPLPPRRPPVAPGPTERRPMPQAPRLPDSIMREDPAPMVNHVPPPPGLVPSSPVAPEGQSPAAQVPPAAAPRPSFLKPLPTRAPIKPLKRVTPQVPPPGQGEGSGPGATPAAPPMGPPKAAAPSAPPSSAPPARPTAPPKVAPPPPSPAADKADALDSLEEEMAKLLGRGPGG